MCTFVSVHVKCLRGSVPQWAQRPGLSVCDRILANFSCTLSLVLPQPAFLSSLSYSLSDPPLSPPLPLSPFPSSCTHLFSLSSSLTHLSPSSLSLYPLYLLLPLSLKLPSLSIPLSFSLSFFPVLLFSENILYKCVFIQSFLSMLDSIETTIGKCKHKYLKTNNIIRFLMIIHIA